ncbi:histidine phosphatase family protein [Reichenbachiella sp. MSK19-1]|uniref:SixA phosphatase family protein n=1 Tax=Reichenbachiella sp. MSK19-1 TaxID=1897631 RepID=UPI000E6D1F98|nr:histidine phosphatase family protein [Reichenbachiella sp. MSK19-1]
MVGQSIKRLIIVRHAKSSWDDASLTDHDRPLAKRGMRDAPRMAEYLCRYLDRPDMVLTSTAIRARQTADYFTQALGTLPHQVRETSALFHAGPSEISAVLSQLPPSTQSVMLFGHNPGFTDFVNQLTAENIENIPTCGVAVISLQLGDWQDVRSATGQLEHYFYPKGI